MNSKRKNATQAFLSPSIDLSEKKEKPMTKLIAAAASALPVAAGEILEKEFAGHVYYFKVPSFARRAAWRRSLTAAGVRFASDDECILAAAEDIAGSGVETAAGSGVAPGAGSGADASAMLRDFAALPKADRSPEQAAAVDAALQSARRLGGKLARLEAGRQEFIDYSAYFALRHFLVGWGRQEPFKGDIGKGGAHDADVAHLNDGEIREIGLHIANLINLSETEAKNFASSPPSGGDPAISPPVSTISPAETADGSLTANDAPTTPPNG